MAASCKYEAEGTITREWKRSKHFCVENLVSTDTTPPKRWQEIDAHTFAASAYIEKGMYSEAIAEARKASELSESSNPTALRSGDLANSRKHEPCWSH
ncbi:MAG: hypothetical protein H0V18_08375 [Pyrinomonadaceae bacterium]|nr:hypothetical protein [Pyrinomonadaceae bacterium]